MNGRIRIFRYELGLTTPIRLAGVEHVKRKGLLLMRVVGDREIWAEAAPLPGFSSESLEQVEAAAVAGDWTRYPSLQFGSSCLYQTPPGHPDAIEEVATNGLLMGSLETISQERNRITRLPYPALKLKVGRPGHLDDELEFVRELVRILRPDQSLRLDANRAWTCDEAVRFCGELPEGAIEYIEEPTQSPCDLERLYEATGVPYALDETLKESPFRADFPNCKALVVKPTLLGNAMEQFFTWNLPVTFSAAFESRVGLHQIARYAARHAPSTPCGLDTIRWLEDGHLRAGLEVQPGRCRIGPSICVAADTLQEVKR